MPQATAISHSGPLTSTIRLPRETTRLATHRPVIANVRWLTAEGTGECHHRGHREHREQAFGIDGCRLQRRQDAWLAAVLLCGLGVLCGDLICRSDEMVDFALAIGRDGRG